MNRLIVITLLWALTATTGWAQSRVAFVVGNSTYESVTSLDNPENDALDISVALEGLGFEVILGSNQSNAEMRASAARFAIAALTADAALFYYAGHGFQVEGQNYLVPTDAAIATAGDVADETIPLAEILSAM